MVSVKLTSNKPLSGQVHIAIDPSSQLERGCGGGLSSPEKSVDFVENMF
jgi:hypothetical protein